jgi:hypothetical protein
MNATMSQIGMGVLLHEGILRFDHFAICDRRIINALQCFKNVILVVRFFVNRYPDPISCLPGGLCSPVYFSDF